MVDDIYIGKHSLEKLLQVKEKIHKRKLEPIRKIILYEHKIKASYFYNWVKILSLICGQWRDDEIWDLMYIQDCIYIKID